MILSVRGGGGGGVVTHELTLTLWSRLLCGEGGFINKGLLVRKMEGFT